MLEVLFPLLQNQFDSVDTFLISFRVEFGVAHFVALDQSFVVLVVDCDLLPVRKFLLSDFAFLEVQ